MEEGISVIRLVKIDAKNALDVGALKVKRSQRHFVDNNKNSIIDAYTTIGTNCTAFPFGIYNDDEPIGFIMIGYNEAVMYEYWFDDLKAPEVYRNNYTIWRFMIDKRYQHRGYGREALKLAIEFVKTLPCGEAEYCALSYSTRNKPAKEFYRSFGFVENGEKDGGEIVAVLKL